MKMKLELYKSPLIRLITLICSLLLLAQTSCSEIKKSVRDSKVEYFKNNDPSVQEDFTVSTKLEKCNTDVGPISYLHFQNIHQVVHLSKYILEGMPYRIRFIDKTNSYYDNNPEQKELYSTSKKRLAVQVIMKDVIYTQKGTEPLNFENKRFIFHFPGALKINYITEDEIFKNYLHKNFYFFCWRMNQLEGEDGVLQHCMTFLADPDVLPLPINIEPELNAAIKKERQGIYPNPEYCTISKYKDDNCEYKEKIKCK